MKYQYSDSVQITPHFNSAEFRCKCGKGLPASDVPLTIRQ